MSNLVAVFSGRPIKVKLDTSKLVGLVTLRKLCTGYFQTFLCHVMIVKGIDFIAESTLNKT